MVQRKFDAIHEFHYTFKAQPRSTDERQFTMLPIIMNDDALGDPMSFNANPEHASWAEQARPNCYPDSEIRNLKIKVWAIIDNTDANMAGFISYQYAIVSSAFPEDLDALDEKSGLTIKEIVELQKESTDRQCYPLWNAKDMSTPSVVHADIPGLTTDQNLEAVAFDSEIFRDQKRYGKVKGLLKKMCPIGIKTRTLTPNRLKAQMWQFTLNFLPSNAKFINPYTGLFLLIGTPKSGGSSTVIDPTKHQLMPNVSFTDNVTGITFFVHVMYNERNPEFHMAKV